MTAIQRLATRGSEPGQSARGSPVRRQAYRNSERPSGQTPRARRRVSGMRGRGPQVRFVLGQFSHWAGRQAERRFTRRNDRRPHPEVRGEVCPTSLLATDNVRPGGRYWGQTSIARGSAILGVAPFHCSGNCAGNWPLFNGGWSRRVTEDRMRPGGEGEAQPPRCGASPLVKRRPPLLTQRDASELPRQRSANVQRSVTTILSGVYAILEHQELHRRNCRRAQFLGARRVVSYAGCYPLALRSCSARVARMAAGSCAFAAIHQARMTATWAV